MRKISFELAFMLFVAMLLAGFILGWGAKTNDNDQEIETYQRALAAFDTKSVESAEIDSLKEIIDVYEIRYGADTLLTKSYYVKLQIQECHKAYLWMLANRPYPPEKSWRLVVKWWEKRNAPN